MSGRNSLPWLSARCRRQDEAHRGDVLAARIRRSNEEPVTPTEELLAEAGARASEPVGARVVTRPTENGCAWLSAPVEPGFAQLVACEARR